MNRHLRAFCTLAAALVAALVVTGCHGSPTGLESESSPPTARRAVTSDSTVAPELTDGGANGGATLTDPGAPPAGEERGGGYGVGSGH